MTYVRPPLDVGEYLDESGTPIPYGARWDMGSPPDDTYSVTRHPERFAPLVKVGEALRDYLIATYDVTVDGDRLVPSDPAAPAMTITFRDFPSVEFRAGVAGVARGPMCGCDACDESVEDAAEELENFALAVAEGRFFERLDGRWLQSGWSYRDGGMSHEGRRKDFDKHAVAALRTHGPWQPWPLR